MEERGKAHRKISSSKYTLRVALCVFHAAFALQKRLSCYKIELGKIVSCLLRQEVLQESAFPKKENHKRT